MFHLALTALVIFSAAFAAAGEGQYTQRADANRDAAFSNELYLTPSNVNSNQFGNLFSYDLDGYVVAQPLYVPGVNISGSGVVNVSYVVTMHDSVYAFNADTRGNGAPLWQVNFLNPANGVTTEPISAQGCSAVTGFTEVGIMGTPVIDSATNTMYLVAKTQEVAGGVTSYVFRLHALDITNGAEKFGGPTVITASVMNGKTQVTLNTQLNLQRPALLESNGSIFIGFGSNGCDRNAHGWLLAYSASTLQQQAVFNTSPAKAWGSSLWMSGVGPAADSEGNIYIITANGTFDVSTGGSDYGDTILKLTLNGSVFTVADYFTPFDQANMSSQDLDLGAGGAVLLPDQSSGPPHLLVAAGKTGTIYLVNRDNMGGYNSSTDQVVQELPAAVGGIWGAPIYWNNALYFAGRQDHIKAFPFINGVVSTTPVQTQFGYSLQGIPSLSANGNSNGVLWLVREVSSSNSTMEMSAFNASTLQTYLTEIYNTQQNSARDALGTAPHFTMPMIANGKLYVGTNTQLKVYGLFNQLNPSAGNNQTGTVNTSINLTAQATNPYTGAGLANVSVVFSDAGRGGSFNPTTVKTDSQGNAITVYTLPQTSGGITITATSSGYSTATFLETATAGAPASISLVSGATQSGVVATTLPKPLVVKVKDLYGNSVVGASVTYSDGGLPGSVFSPNPSVAGSNGQASSVYTLPTVAKTGYAVTASSGSATPGTFHETSLAAAPASLAITGGNKQSGTHGTKLPKSLIVSVKDQYGNGVPNTVVTFTDNGAGGSFSTTTPLTNNAGNATVTYTLPPSQGTITITASLGGLSVNFTETSK
ncbi:MAG: hypothetical protein WCA16_01880 [Candidatus Sulfotelmatobacter sp.]